ncbi:MAG TPA: DUF3040 domain-containing protein [Nakamurella sp.]
MSSTILHEIETFTQSADPGFAANLDLVTAQELRRRRMAMSGSGFWFGLVILIVGLAAARGPISVGVLVACYGLILMVWATVTAQRNRVRRKGRQAGNLDLGKADHG